MEIKNSDQPTNPSETPIQPVSNPGNNRRGFFPIILVALLLLVIVSVGAYYLGTQNSRTTQTTNITTTPTPTPILIYAPTLTMTPMPPTPTPPSNEFSPIPMTTWKTFTYPGDAFTIQYPPSWTVTQGHLNGGGTGVSLDGVEGDIGVIENLTFGRSCSKPTDPIQIHGETLYGCYFSDPNGSGEWDQYAKVVSPTKKYGIQAVVVSSAEKNKSVILQVLSTLSFAK